MAVHAPNWRFTHGKWFHKSLRPVGGYVMVMSVSWLVVIMHTQDTWSLTAMHIASKLGPAGLAIAYAVLAVWTLPPL